MARTFHIITETASIRNVSVELTLARNESSDRFIRTVAYLLSPEKKKSIDLEHKWEDIAISHLSEKISEMALGEDDAEILLAELNEILAAGQTGIFITKLEYTPKTNPRVEIKSMNMI